MEFNLAAMALLAILVVGIIYVAYLYKNKKFKEMYTIVKALVDEAEATFGSGTGPIKYKYVTDKLAQAIPTVLKSYITKDLIDYWITLAVDELQKTLEDKIKEEETK